MSLYLGESSVLKDWLRIGIRVRIRRGMGEAEVLTFADSPCFVLVQCWGLKF